MSAVLHKLKDTYPELSMPDLESMINAVQDSVGRDADDTTVFGLVETIIHGNKKRGGSQVFYGVIAGYKIDDSNRITREQIYANWDSAPWESMLDITQIPVNDKGIKQMPLTKDEMMRKKMVAVRSEVRNDKTILIPLADTRLPDNTPAWKQESDGTFSGTTDWTDKLQCHIIPLIFNEKMAKSIGKAAIKKLQLYLYVIVQNPKKETEWRKSWIQCPLTDFDQNTLPLHVPVKIKAAFALTKDKAIKDSDPYFSLVIRKSMRDKVALCAPEEVNTTFVNWVKDNRFRIYDFYNSFKQAVAEIKPQFKKDEAKKLQYNAWYLLQGTIGQDDYGYGPKASFVDETGNDMLNGSFYDSDDDKHLSRELEGTENSPVFLATVARGDKQIRGPDGKYRQAKPYESFSLTPLGVYFIMKKPAPVEEVIDEDDE